MALALFFTLLFVLIGGPLVTLWVGDSAGRSSQLLVILTLGELLPMSQWVSHGIILGMGRHRELAWLSIVEAVLAVASGIAVARPFGLTGVGLVFAITGALCRGVAQLIYACHVVGIPVSEYLRRSVLPAISAATIPAAGLYCTVVLLVPRTWEAFLICLATYTVCWTVTGVLLAWHRLSRLIIRKPEGA
jgi:O-antigen/teichoic acid export membrane protein